MDIGYIGLGAMGGALASRLMATRLITVWDLNDATVDTFVKDGAIAATSLLEMARRCDVILLCLPRSADVRHVIFGPGGLIEGLSAGKTVIDQSSGTPAETLDMGQQLALRGVAMLDAPVSGNSTVFAAGNGTVMVSGPDEAHERMLPLLRELTPKVLRAGRRLGDAQAMKLVNNTINSGCRLATLEVVAMGRKMGVPLQSLIDIVNTGDAANSTTRVMLPALLKGRTSTNFALALMLKDLNQSTSLGMANGAPMPIASIVRGLLQIGVNTLGANARLEDVVQLTESMAGTCIAGSGPDTPLTLLAEQTAAMHHTLAACNAAVTHEAFAMGLKFGLILQDLYTVITASSGWSGAAERILPATGSSAAPDVTPLGTVTAHVRRACEMAVACGAPMLIANATRCLLETAGQAMGPGAATSEALTRC